MLSSLSILIPTYNDEKTIEKVVRGASRTGKDLAKKYEVVVLNDGSTNSIPNILATLQKKLPELRVLHHSINKGYGETIRDLYYAGKYEWLVTLPGDDQIDAAEIKKLAKETDAADMILGKREHRGDHLLRRIQSRTYNTVLSLFFHIPTTDVNTIRLMKKEILRHISLKMNSPFVDAELVLKAAKKGYVIREIPITHKSRKTAGATGGKLFRTIVPTILDLLRYFFGV